VPAYDQPVPPGQKPFPPWNGRIKLALMGFDCLVKTIGEAIVPELTPKADRSVEPSEVSQLKPKFGKARILLAEDNRTNQYVSLGLLRKLGYEADIAGNGLQALEALKSIPYDVIFMDCQMPEMDGYDAARAIRRQEQTLDQSFNPKRHVHIIALTVNAMQGDREKCLAAGMDARTLQNPSLKSPSRF
jgi:CheY-like chemotaxis protein